ncbi:MAG: ribokinase [Pseudomonadota bacterium]
MSKSNSIVVFGSANVDLVVRCARLPRPGETVTGSGHQLLPGGKGANQALAARRAGGDVSFCGAVGRDAFADTALANLIEAGVGLDGLHRIDAPTGLASICVDASGENAIAISPGANAAAALARDMTADDLLVTQNEVPAAAVGEAHRRAKAAGARVVHNAAPAAPLSADQMQLIDDLIVNELEFAEIARAFDSAPDPTPEGLLALAKATETRIVVTLGPAGARAALGGVLLDVPARAIKPLDTTGAGDAFVGAYAAALAAGGDDEAALSFAVAAGTLACLALGAQSSSPTAAEIEAHLSGA